LIFNFSDAPRFRLKAGLLYLLPESSGIHALFYLHPNKYIFRPTSDIGFLFLHFLLEIAKKIEIWVNQTSA